MLQVYSLLGLLLKIVITLGKSIYGKYSLRKVVSSQEQYKKNLETVVSNHDLLYIVIASPIVSGREKSYDSNVNFDNPVVSSPSFIYTYTLYSTYGKCVLLAHSPI